MSAASRDTDLPVAVVIATRDRPDDLARCVAALHAQRGSPPFEIVLVDDGSTPSLSAPVYAGAVPVRVLRTAGIGPAGARNAGVRSVAARIILFTDDDTLPSEEWVMAATARLRDYPFEVAVEGPVFTPPYDALRAYSVATDRPGHYWTCNIAYRRSVLDALGGFAEDVFPFAHCEDRDLAFRALQVGPIGFATGMAVMHTPRAQSIMSFVRRGRWVASEIELVKRHPARFEHTRTPLPRPLGLAVGHARNWQRRWRAERRVLLRDPRSLVRFVVIATGHVAVTLAVALKRTYQAHGG